MPPETSTTALRGSERPSVIAASLLPGRDILQLVACLLGELASRVRRNGSLQRVPCGGVLPEGDLAVGDTKLCFGGLGAVRVLPQQRLERGQCRLVVLGDLVRTAQPVVGVRNQRALRILVDEGTESARRVYVVAVAQRLERRIVRRLRRCLVGRRHRRG